MQGVYTMRVSRRQRKDVNWIASIYSPGEYRTYNDELQRLSFPVIFLHNIIFDVYLYSRYYWCILPHSQEAIILYTLRRVYERNFLFAYRRITDRMFRFNVPEKRGKGIGISLFRPITVRIFNNHSRSYTFHCLLGALSFFIFRPIFPLYRHSNKRTGVI